MKIAMFDLDKMFLNKVCQKLSSQYEGELEVVPVENEKIMESDEFDLFITSNKTDGVNFPVMYLCDSRENEDESNNKYCKYVPVDEFKTNIDKVYLKYKAYNIIPISVTSTNIISYVSLGSGIGSTSVATGAAINFANNGKKTLYLDLKPLQPVGLFSINSQVVTYEDILNDLNQKSGKISDIINSIYLDNTGVYVLKMYDSIISNSNINCDDFGKVLSIIAFNGNFDAIIINTALVANNLFEYICGISKALCFTLDGSEYINRKFDSALSYINEVDSAAVRKVKAIYSKFRMMPAIPEKYNSYVLGGVSYVEGEKYNDVVVKSAGLGFHVSILE